MGKYIVKSGGGIEKEDVMNIMPYMDGITGYFDISSIDLANKKWLNRVDTNLIDKYDMDLINGGAKKNNALYLTAAQYGQLQMSTEPQTIYCVYKMITLSGVYSPVISKKTTAKTTRYDYAIYANTKNCIYMTLSTYGISSDISPSDYHVVCITKQNNMAYLYIDGILIDSTIAYNGYFGEQCHINRNYRGTGFIDTPTDVEYRMCAFGTMYHDEQMIKANTSFLMSGSLNGITPEILGYTSGAVNFFDGIYNFAHKHVDNGLFWIDLVNDFVMSRDSGSVYDDYYDKSTGTDSIFLGMKNMYDAFTFEVVCKINSYSGEFDFASNFEKAGAGVYVENGELYASIRDTNAYKNIITSFNLGEMYVMQLTFDGKVFKFYLNGQFINSIEVKNYIKSDYPCSLGGFKNGAYANGSCNFYRFTLYDRALTDNEIIKNYNSDKKRFNIQ